jgi:hypothetical protein
MNWLPQIDWFLKRDRLSCDDANFGLLSPPIRSEIPVPR